MTREQIIAEIYQQFTFTPVLDRMWGTQWFGENRFGLDKNGKSHYQRAGLLGHPAIDWKAVFVPAYATFDGTVVVVDSDPFVDGVHGEYVEVDSDPFEIDRTQYKIRALYYHISVATVDVRQRVQAGDPVCITGNTGEYTSGPHLHFTITVYKADLTGRWIKAFPDNGYTGRIDSYPFFALEDIQNPRTVNDFIFANSLVRYKHDPRVYWVDDKGLYWWIRGDKKSDGREIRGEDVFEYMMAKERIGKWDEIQIVNAKIKHNFIATI